MGFFRRIAGIFGGSRDDAAGGGGGGDVPHEKVAAAAAAAAASGHATRRGFSVQVPVPVDRPAAGPVLAPCPAGDGGVQPPLQIRSSPWLLPPPPPATPILPAPPSPAAPSRPALGSFLPLLTTTTSSCSRPPRATTNSGNPQPLHPETLAKMCRDMEERHPPAAFGVHARPTGGVHARIRLLAPLSGRR